MEIPRGDGSTCLFLNLSIGSSLGIVLGQGTQPFTGKRQFPEDLNVLLGVGRGHQSRFQSGKLIYKWSERRDLATRSKMDS